MPESAADTLRRLAEDCRGSSEVQARLRLDSISRYHGHLAELFDAIAAEMDDYSAVKEGPGGVGIEFLGKFQPSPIWTPALAVARAHFGGDEPDDPA